MECEDDEWWCKKLPNQATKCNMQMDVFSKQEDAWNAAKEANTPVQPLRGIMREWNLPLEEFRARYASLSEPVILRGATVEAMMAEQFTLEYLEATCGDAVFTPRVRSNDSKDVQSAFGMSEGEPTKLKYFFQKLRNRTLEKAWYLFDYGIPAHCPSASKAIIMPEYLANDAVKYFKEMPIATQWPSLLVGPAGSGTALHVDSYATHFYMRMISGRKRWRIYHRDQEHLLYPNHMHISLGYDMEYTPSTQAPLQLLSTPWEFVLESGDLLVVPYSFPHQVTNIDQTISVAGNYVDEANWDKFVEELRTSASDVDLNLGLSEAQMLDQIEDEGISPPFEALGDPSNDGSSREEEEEEIEGVRTLGARQEGQVKDNLKALHWL